MKAINDRSQVLTKYAVNSRSVRVTLQLSDTTLNYVYFPCGCSGPDYATELGLLLGYIDTRITIYDSENLIIPGVARFECTPTNSGLHTVLFSAQSV
jgi:hypothetical protein